MRICGIYLIVSPSGRRYIGSSNNMAQRWRLYRTFKCGGQKLLFNSLKKYSPENHKFSLLFRCSERDRFIWERIFGDLYLSLHDFGGLNLSLPQYEDRPFALSYETREVISKNAKEYYENNPEAIDRFREGSKRFRDNNPDKIQEMQDKATEAKRTPEYRAKRSAIAKELGLRPEVRKERSDRMYKRFSDPKERKAQSERTKKFMSVPGNSPSSKKVINIETGEIYPSATFASKFTGHNAHWILNRLGGVTKNGTPYRYLDDIKKEECLR